MSFFKDLYGFLGRLHEHNSKEWMDANRREYYHIRDEYVAWLNELDTRLKRIDPAYVPTEGKKAIHRINNNLMFHPDKPVYKNHIGATMDRVKGKSDFYIHLGWGESFIAGGFYHPPSSVVRAVREAIDYDGEVLQKIIEDPEFKSAFGDLMNEDALKTSPKDYPSDHPHIGLLRLRSYAVEHAVTREDVQADDFMDRVVRLYEIVMPFRHYLDRAVAYDIDA